MWISKKKYAQLERRIDELEAFKRDSVYYRYFDVLHPEAIKRAKEQSKIYSATGICYPVPISTSGQQRISIKDVLERVLAHIGLELVYREGTSSGVDIVKASKKS